MHIMLQIVKFYEILIHPTRKPYVDFIIQNNLVINTEMTFLYVPKYEYNFLSYTISLFLINFSPIFFLMVNNPLTSWIPCINPYLLQIEWRQKIVFWFFFFWWRYFCADLELNTNKMCEINHAFTYHLPTIFYGVWCESTLYLYEILSNAMT